MSNNSSKKQKNGIKLIVHGRWVLPIESEEQAGTILRDHAVVVDTDGCIADLLPSTEADAKYGGGGEVQVVRLAERHVLLPGLVNCHTHAAMTLLRGYAEDVDLMTWLQQYIWPAEAAHVSAEFVRDGTELAIEEMVRGGATCFNDMYFFPEETARLCHRVGMRAVVGAPVLSFPNAWAPGGPADAFRLGEELLVECRDYPLVDMAWAPHSCYALDDAGLQRVAELAERHNTRVHTHLHESPSELASHHEQHQCRPLDRLRRAGLLTGRLVAAHMTQVTDDEAKEVAQAGAAVCHCPESNMKLGSGTFRLHWWLQQHSGATVALGTDGAASNDDLDMLGELRTAALLDKSVCHDASANASTSGPRLLAAATLGGARALGLADRIGSLVVGKQADFIAVALDAEPVYHPISTLIYNGSNRVTDVWVAGKPLLRDGQSTVFDRDALRQKAVGWRDKILKTSHHE